MHAATYPMAQARGKATGFVPRRCRRCHYKKSPDLDCACYNYHKQVDIGEKLVSVGFESLYMAH